MIYNNRKVQVLNFCTFSTEDYNMIKLICFDLDGVLADLCESHKESLNSAIKKIAGSQFMILDSEHYTMYNGLSTKKKLTMLVKHKNLNSELVEKIHNLKQKLTIKEIKNKIKVNDKLINDLKKLKSENYQLACVSNAVYKTVKTSLKKLGVLNLFDYILSNESVKRQKPFPDLYLQAMIYAGVDCKETLILEDSDIGIQAAIASRGYVLRVSSDTTETNYENINNKIIDITNY